MTARRQIIKGFLGASLAAAGLPVSAAKSGRRAPWVRRLFHMHTNGAGESVIRKLPVPPLGTADTTRLLRRAAERITVGSMAPGFMMDFHIANQPNFLIPIFGSLVVELKDGSRWVFGPGDILLAEDCTGGGHRSGAGPEGCFSVSVQIPKTEHCLDAARDPAVLLSGGDGPAQ